MAGGEEAARETAASASPDDDVPTAGGRPQSSSSSPPPPPLPARLPTAAAATASRSPSSPAAKLQGKATTAVSSIDIQTLSFPDGSRGTFSSQGTRAASTPSRLRSGYATPSGVGMVPLGGSSDADDSMSVASFAPTQRPPGDLASLIAAGLNRKSRAWQLLRAQSAGVPPFAQSSGGGAADGDASREDPLAGFAHEFDGDDALDAAAPGGGMDDEEARLRRWKARLKHYMILSSAGKPIWSRHGDLSLINSYMGVVQTIISFYEEGHDPLRSFTAGDARFVIATEGPLYLVAISRLGESDAQLRSQLDALYMQILSTLTLPTLTNIFTHRPSSDLRKPLEGTESLLSALADSFTRGSPSAMLGALECLRLRKSQRHAIDNTFLKQRCDKLLYGLIVAGGRLVSVIRPRRHSLHPSDLELIFNMLFESDGIKAGGGENWIPLCLPAFNNRGYLYMYVSFFDKPTAAAAAGDQAAGRQQQPPPPRPPMLSTDSSFPSSVSPEARLKAQAKAEEEIAIILISPDKESFFELKEMRDRVAQQLTKNGGLAVISAAAAAGRPRVADVAPGSQITHFLYKSRANVQFVSADMSGAFGPAATAAGGDAEDDDECPPSAAADAATAAIVARRRLMTEYHRLHAAAHARHSHLRVLHCSGLEATSLAWLTPVFELYCVAGPNASRAVVTQGANRLVQWAKREEQRLFIVGGGVF